MTVRQEAGSLGPQSEGSWHHIIPSPSAPCAQPLGNSSWTCFSESLINLVLGLPDEPALLASFSLESERATNCLACHASWQNWDMLFSPLSPNYPSAAGIPPKGAFTSSSLGMAMEGEPTSWSHLPQDTHMA